MNRPWVPLYELQTEDSGYEHVNPNVIFDAYIAGEEDGLYVVITLDINQNTASFNFKDIKEAQRFINRLGGIV